MTNRLITLTFLLVSFFSFAQSAKGGQKEVNSALSSPSSALTTEVHADVITVVGTAKYRKGLRPSKKISLRQKLMARRAAQMDCYRKIGSSIDSLYLVDGTPLKEKFAKKNFNDLRGAIARSAQFSPITTYTKVGVELQAEVQLSRVKKVFGLDKLYRLLKSGK